ncbi:MAG: hypothetical protein KJN90_10895 [Gammaproteobacteria bacterium]|nr:hypothetical protein [Gammaproteobacteria bacterium]
MAKLLFRLRHVPEDEADEVRALLEEHDIDFYETSAGNWRIAMPAIWLRNEDQLPLARQLLDQYQQVRYQNARAQYEELRQSGEHPTLWKNFLEQPAKVALYLGAAVVILYLSLQVFVSLG